MMKKLHYPVTFSLTVALLTVLLVLSAMIPKSAIRENVLESARFLCDGPLFGTAVEGVEGSRIDRYADSILLGIAWQYDGERPLGSVMESSYYYTDDQNENQNLLDAVSKELPANQQYLRYWHGSIVFLRPLLCVFSLPQIYALNGVVLAALTIWLLAELFRKKAFVPAFGVGLGLVMTASWFVPLSLEYTWCYFVMLAGSILAVKLAFSEKWQHMGTFFLLSGMVTNYLDFLTTETLTLLIPLLLVLWLRKEKTALRPVVVKGVLAWGCGYVGMWITKWLLAALVMGENVIPFVINHVQERLGGNLGLSLGRYMTGAVLRNIRCLFPLEYGTLGVLIMLGLVVFGSYAGYVHQKKSVHWDRVLLFALLGLVPYVRYLVLHNHAWLHCFFTYRAQLATVLAVVMILEEMTDWKWLKKKACP